LRGVQADARRRVLRFEHVVDELLEKRIADLRRVDAFGDLAERRMVIRQNRAQIGHGCL
jgi:hypothetical protein